MSIFWLLRRLFKKAKPIADRPKGQPEREGGPLTCPYCGCTQFFEGPSGGMSTNIMCANPKCEHWFNYHGGLIPMDNLHQVGKDRRPI